MQIEIIGKNITVTQALSDHINGKIQRLARDVSGIGTIQVVLATEKNTHVAQATVRFQGADITSSASHSDMYVAIGMLAKQVRRAALKRKTRHAPGPRHDEMVHALELESDEVA